MQTIQGKWVKQFGRIYRSWLGFRTFVHISTPIFMEVNKNVFYSFNTNFDFYGIPCVVILFNEMKFFF
jgi:hypothetical protein